DGKLGELHLSQVPASFYARAFALSTGKQLETAENYTVTLRLRVSYTAADTSVLTGEERRSIFVHHDPDWPAGFPRRIRNGAACAGGQVAPGAAGDYCFSPGGEGQPALADVAGLGRLQIVFGDTDGVVPLESPRTPREYSRVPHKGMFAAPILADWDGDGRLEIIQAGYDGHIQQYRADGTEVRTGNWPIQVRVPDSVPITRPALNNPSDTRTPIRMQDFRISSNPALAQLDGDPELEIVVRSQMSDTMPSTDVEVLPGVGHPIAYDHDGTYLWTA